MGDYRGVVISQRGKAARQAELELRKRKRALEQRDLGASREASDVGTTHCGRRMKTDVDRQHDIECERIQELEQILEQARVAPAPMNSEKLRMGLVGTWSRRETVAEARLAGRNSRRMTYETYEVVGYGEGDCNTEPKRLSYDSARIKPFIAQAAGYEDTVYPDGRPVTWKLARIDFSTG